MKKQLGLLAATLFFFHGNSNNVRAFYVQVDVSCQYGAGPSMSFVPTSTFTSSAVVAFTSDSFKFDLVICTVPDSAQNFLRKLQNRSAYLLSVLWEGFCFVLSLKCLLLLQGKDLMCHNYTFGSLGCM